MRQHGQMRRGSAAHLERQRIRSWPRSQCRSSSNRCRHKTGSTPPPKNRLGEQEAPEDLVAAADALGQSLTVWSPAPSTPPSGASLIATGTVWRRTSAMPCSGPLEAVAAMLGRYRPLTPPGRACSILARGHNPQMILSPNSPPDRHSRGLFYARRPGCHQPVIPRRPP